MDQLVPPLMFDYVDRHHVTHLLQSLVQLLLLHHPEDPLSFLQEALKAPSDHISRVMLLGPPAVGKTSLAKRLSVELRADHVTLEKLLEDQSESSVHSQQDAGDELLVGLLDQRLKEMERFHKGWVLEGFPQTRLQALSLQQVGILPDHVVILDAPQEVLQERAQGRLLDPLTGDVYHQTFICPPDYTITQRLERGRVQSEEQRNAELQRFRQEVPGLSSAYQHVLKVVNGEQAPNDLYQQVYTFVKTYHRSRTPRILLLGPPGSGKSLQAKLLSEKYKLVDVCCGQLLRSVSVGSSSLGEKVGAYIDDGRPVPDSAVLQVLQQRLGGLDCVCRGWILHGFPRDLQQARSLQGAPHRPNRVFFLEVSDDVCVKRISLRATDPVTGQRYHSVTRPAPNPLVQSRLMTRPEDRLDAVKHSLRGFSVTKAVLQSVYPDAVHIKADRDPHSVFEALESRLTTN